MFCRRRAAHEATLERPSRTWLSALATRGVTIVDPFFTFASCLDFIKCGCGSEAIDGSGWAQGLRSLGASEEQIGQFAARKFKGAQMPERWALSGASLGREISGKGHCSTSTPSAQEVRLADFVSFVRDELSGGCGDPFDMILRNRALVETTKLARVRNNWAQLVALRGDAGEGAGSGSGASSGSRSAGRSSSAGASPTALAVALVRQNPALVMHPEAALRVDERWFDEKGVKCRGGTKGQRKSQRLKGVRKG